VYIDKDSYIDILGISFDTTNIVNGFLDWIFEPKFLYTFLNLTTMGAVAKNATLGPQAGSIIYIHESVVKA
jgi:hypothetical protein